MIDRMKLRKGFTLVELCVVIGIVSIIVALCCTFIASYHKNVYDLERNKDAMREMASVKTTINSWLVLYDSGYYDFQVDAGNSGKVNAVESEDAKSKNVSNILEGSIVFDNGRFECIGKKNSVVTFEYIDSIVFERDTGLLLATVTAKNSRTQKLAFTVFSDTERNRYASDERLMVQKGQNTIYTWLEDNPNITKVEESRITAQNGLVSRSIQFDAETKQLVEKNVIGKKTFYIGNPEKCVFKLEGNKLYCTLTKNGVDEVLVYEKVGGKWQ